ncbi:hypothetical protein [Cupriavidus basilensis]|uniref:Uncharacterized protein n=1 Tax=Cupriavidus basilensis TaxID=68895 RepID=A0A643FTA9_9BURK|nr:hypothetical protein [Cupriavidus basilensis]QOT82214.1 hypothetical protein F7R26_039575 [Cupriavidus basilensis]
MNLTPQQHQEHIEKLKRYRDDWQTVAASAAAERDRLLDLASRGASLGHDVEADILQRAAEQKDALARKAHEAQIYMESQLGHAQAGL